MHERVCVCGGGGDVLLHGWTGITLECSAAWLPVDNTSLLSPVMCTSCCHFQQYPLVLRLHTPAQPNLAAWDWFRETDPVL